MANQIIKLKRSNVPGKKPTTGDLELGELAVNTFDGNFYFETDAGSIEQVITTTAVTGSLNISGSFAFKGPFLIKNKDGGTALEVNTDGYVVLGEYTSSLSNITSPQTGTMVLSGSELHLYS